MNNFENTRYPKNVYNLLQIYKSSVFMQNLLKNTNDFNKDIIDAFKLSYEHLKTHLNITYGEFIKYLLKLVHDYTNIIYTDNNIFQYVTLVEYFQLDMYEEFFNFIINKYIDNIHTVYYIELCSHKPIQHFILSLVHKQSMYTQNTLKNSINLINLNEDISNVYKQSYESLNINLNITYKEFIQYLLNLIHDYKHIIYTKDNIVKYCILVDYFQLNIREEFFNFIVDEYIVNKYIIFYNEFYLCESLQHFILLKIHKQSTYTQNILEDSLDLKKDINDVCKQAYELLNVNLDITYDMFIQYLLNLTYHNRYYVMCMNNNILQYVILSDYFQLDIQNEFFNYIVDEFIFKYNVFYAKLYLYNQIDYYILDKIDKTNNINNTTFSYIFKINKNICKEITTFCSKHIKQKLLDKCVNITDLNICENNNINNVDCLHSLMNFDTTKYAITNLFNIKYVFQLGSINIQKSNVNDKIICGDNKQWYLKKYEQL